MYASDLLAGKKILITGGGTGLGKSIGRRYLELGAELVIAGRRLEVLNATLAEFREAMPGVRVSAVQVDVRDAESVETMMETIWRDGPLDVLLCNAAANFIARTETLSSRAVDAVLDIVLHGSFYCAIAAGKRWIAEGRPGNVISTVSTPTMTGSAFTAPSAAAKAGVLAMTRSLAVEWGPKGIRLNCVAPGLFPTPGAWEQLYPQGSQVEPQDLSVPLRRFGEHQELADLYSYLACDGSGYITGEMIVIDGGRWMQGVGGPTARAMQGWSEDQWEAMRNKGRK
ncbi:NAD(P)-dependent dehydrogenase (short-subunit alcohol dehydrogenase family) [Pseudomonas sp. SJZ103]|uniref:SDR family oxidoreductase n=1 Tax=unclassified Pseudomonas TaxID=196821 RepID=UPI0011A620DB|nr:MULTISPECIES: SDR family oxidoreductase [unclassified Pseudomonas]MBB6290742.1 NAD(P)-dependent dehydrogenase (short-subunit alcohol dehydrogenase family) [Pseudomonas sp. SJZ073]MBB6315530.1 NAD(P)-dependent dehydrogenase (short-subunit alcohol dehydrogenase family) [Pseudomonas sp. JAI120]TWC61551.1 NAD(P)-dependent dehydrogenase (short-subunit alcohol dehydrogenase family) [Pseudomonas sp. SJZ103]TWC78747.1 NAD(P)-dependent dehydrogenase (short-subunit alcohol dehydrogenase family) [Pseud